jgi:hypothetical protein
MQTFITTYQSFTTPYKLLEKLKQRYFYHIVFFLISRYNAPEKIDKDPKVIRQIQLRVSIVLKYWVENQFKELDDDLITDLSDFFNQFAAFHGGVADLLRKELQAWIQDRSARVKSLLSEPPTNITVIRFSYSN